MSGVIAIIGIVFGWIVLIVIAEYAIQHGRKQ